MFSCIATLRCETTSFAFLSRLHSPLSRCLLFLFIFSLSAENRILLCPPKSELASPLIPLIPHQGGQVQYLHHQISIFLITVASLRLPCLGTLTPPRLKSGLSREGCYLVWCCLMGLFDVLWNELEKVTPGYQNHLILLFTFIWVKLKNKTTTTTKKTPTQNNPLKLTLTFYICHNCAIYLRKLPQLFIAMLCFCAYVFSINLFSIDTLLLSLFFFWLKQSWAIKL